MGTVISLDVGDMGIDWSKNARGADHGSLFQQRDRMWHRSPQTDYDGYEEDELADIERSEMAFVRCLKDVVPRLPLLGFTLERAEAEYQSLVKTWMTEESSETEDADRNLSTRVRQRSLAIYEASAMAAAASVSRRGVCAVA